MVKSITITAIFVGAIGYLAYKVSKSGIHFEVKKGQCYSYDYDMIAGEPMDTIYKVEKADENNYCRIQGDVQRKYFYGSLDCSTRGYAQRRYSDITIVECPDWKWR